MMEEVAESKHNGIGPFSIGPLLAHVTLKLFREFIFARIGAIFVIMFLSNPAWADITLTCNEDMFAKTANRIVICISCNPAIAPVDSVKQATQKILSIVKQCQNLGVEISGTIGTNDDLYFDEVARLLNGEHKDLGLERRVII